MRKCILSIFLLISLTIHVNAYDITAPTAPETAQKYMPENTESFSDGLLEIIKDAFALFMPNFHEASRICISLIAIMLLTTFTGYNSGLHKNTVNIIVVISAAGILLNSANTLINLGVATVKELRDYGKLLLPVMATATASQGAMTSSAALYSGTIIFVTILTGMISRLLVPLVYIFICLTIANACLAADVLKNVQTFVKWLTTWILKLSIYSFTAYMSITGVICGTVDSSAIKAAKLAISGVVPVVGSVISDASESVLLGAGIMKNSAGIYGIFATLAILVGPFLRVGVQYLMLKVTNGICSIFASKEYTGVLEGFCTAMGFVLAMIGTVSVMLLIGIVCFMKGVSV